MVKGYHECSFAVGDGEQFLIKRKRRDLVLKVTDDCRGHACVSAHVSQY